MEIGKKHETAASLGLLGSRLSQKGGQTEASVAFLKTMYAGTDSKASKEQIELRIKALEGILILEKAISQFKSMFFNHPPDTLDRLVEVGILKDLPTNPVRKDGLYLYEDGEIDF